MYLSPLKPRKKKASNSKPLKDHSTDAFPKNEEVISLGQDVKSPATTYNSAGDSTHKGNSKTKLEALKRGILFLRRRHK